MGLVWRLFRGRHGPYTSRGRRTVKPHAPFLVPACPYRMDGSAACAFVGRDPEHDARRVNVPGIARLFERAQRRSAPASPRLGVDLRVQVRNAVAADQLDRIRVRELARTALAVVHLRTLVRVVHGLGDNAVTCATSGSFGARLCPRPSSA
jgi:hypothetical protein